MGPFYRKRGHKVDLMESLSGGFRGGTVNMNKYMYKILTKLKKWGKEIIMEVPLYTMKIFKVTNPK